MAAYSIQRGWIWDSLTQSPNQWLDDRIQVTAQNRAVLTQIQKILREYQTIHENMDLVIAFSEYVAHLDNAHVNQDPIVALLLCILDRSMIEQIVNARGIDRDSLIRFSFSLPIHDSMNWKPGSIS